MAIAEMIIDSYSIFLRQKDIAGNEVLFTSQKSKASGLGFTRPSRRTFEQVNKDGKTVKRSMDPIVISCAETKGGRVSTTGRVANVMEAGKIIAAVETKGVPEEQKLWAWYAYRYNDKDAEEKIKRKLLIAMGEKILADYDTGRITLGKIIMMCGAALEDVRYQTTGDGALHSGADIARRMHITPENFRKRYKPHYDWIVGMIKNDLNGPVIDRAKYAFREIKGFI